MQYVRKSNDSGVQGVRYLETANRITRVPKTDNDVVSSLTLAAFSALRYIRYADPEMQEAIVSSDKIE